MPSVQLSAQTSPPVLLTSRGEPRTAVERDKTSSEHQIAEIMRHLERRYPSERISRTDLEGRVRNVYRQFDAARIRTFVAVFVERLVRRSIEHPPAAEPHSPRRSVESLVTTPFDMFQ
jgi:hypothetical protein